MRFFAWGLRADENAAGAWGDAVDEPVAAAAAAPNAGLFGLENAADECACGDVMSVCDAMEVKRDGCSWRVAAPVENPAEEGNINAEEEEPAGTTVAAEGTEGTDEGEAADGSSGELM